MYPRTQALAEVAWSPESKKEFDSFMARMENFKPYFEYFGMSYAVNSVAMPKKWLLKSKIRKEFSMGDTHLEVKLNKKYIEQGEKKMKFSDFPQAVIKENVDYTVKEITNVIKKSGPRESGNENCYAAQSILKKKWILSATVQSLKAIKWLPRHFSILQSLYLLSFSWQ